MDWSVRSKRGTLSGELVAGHELLHVLAVGGMGEVYLARHMKMGMMRAIKVIHADLRSDETTRERFAREAKVLARLQHNSIIQIVEFGSLANGWPYLAMEYVDGPTLERLLEAGPLPLPSALVVLEQLASAMHYAHTRGVIHRDLKPSNVLLRAGDVRQAKIIDFGLALVQNTEGPRLTDEKQLIGSVAYMAPEQVERKLDVTGAIDVYAVAGIAYRLLSGAAPFTYSSPVRLMKARVTEDPPRLSERCPDIPASLDALLLRCLAKDPAERPAGDEVVAQLEQLSRGTAVAGRTVTGQEPPERSPHLQRISTLVLEAPRRSHPGELALATKIMAMIGEIGASLSTSDPELTSLLQLEARLEEQLALVEADLNLHGSHDAQHAQRSELRRTLQAQQLPLQRRMCEVVERHRRYATGPIKALFDQIDRALDELEAYTGS